MCVLLKDVGMVDDVGMIHFMFHTHTSCNIYLYIYVIYRWWSKLPMFL